MQSGPVVATCCFQKTLHPFVLYLAFKYTPAGAKLGLVPGTQEESDIVIAIENQYRNFHKMNNFRTGGDHFLSNVVEVNIPKPTKRRKRRN
jgi:hypothetical protein